MSWREVVLATLPVAADAGARAAASPAGPIASAAGGAAAGEVTKQLLRELLNAEDEQRQRIEELSRSLNRKLDALIEAPLREARRHLEAATINSSRAELELWAARDNLMRAESQVEQGTARHALICEELAATYGLLTDAEQSTLWLGRAGDAVTQALRREATELHDKLRANSRILGRREQSAPAKPGWSKMGDTHEVDFSVAVETSVAYPALQDLAELTAEAVRIRSECGFVDLYPAPLPAWVWPAPAAPSWSWEPVPRHDPVDVMMVHTGDVDRFGAAQVTRVMLPNVAVRHELQRRLQPVVGLRPRCRNLSKGQHRVRMVGNRPELGNGLAERAPQTDPAQVLFVPIWCDGRPVEYWWVMVEDDGSVLWDEGPANVLNPVPEDLYYHWDFDWHHPASSI